MTRDTRAVIRLSALRANLECARRVAPGARQLCVIKANGYGHGIVEVARALDGADAFGVACLDEALTLREAGIDKPVVLLEGILSAAELEALRQWRLETVVHHAAQVAMLEQAAPGKAVPVWLKIDTGMHRLGVPPEDARLLWQRLADCPAVKGVPRLMTHLANADDRQDPATKRQLRIFDEAIAGLEGERSVANSAGILGWPQTHAEWNRPGIMLYGVSPFGEEPWPELTPAMTLHSTLIAVKRLRRGDPVGYGGRFVCPEDMPVGVAAIGYGDGYPRHAPDGTPVLVNGRPAAIAGTVSMDMLTLDLRHVPDAVPGDPVTLWGDDLPIETVARHAGTIGYELLCKVTKRVRFEYVD
ncbi:MAG TPA: alanine racemase [Gammaproteobacteria bacterium]|nr:alanine racemase [Gammaproteobacteria bacterium]